jgi:hypothetical protein
VPSELAVALAARIVRAGDQRSVDQADRVLGDQLGDHHLHLGELRREPPQPPVVPRLVDVLRALAQQPHQVLQAVDVWTPRDRARRINAARLYEAYAKPSNLDEHLIPLRVPEQRVEHTVDVYENRLLGTFVEQVNTRLRRLIRDATSQSSAVAQQTAGRLLSASCGRDVNAAFLTRSAS